MPQLMPFYWLTSLIISFLVLIVMIEFFIMSIKYKFFIKFMDNKVMEINTWKW